MRNMFFITCFITAASSVSAKQAPPRADVPRVSEVRVVGVTAPTPPAGVQLADVRDVRNLRDGYEYFSEKEFKIEDLKSKEVSKEIAVSKASDIYIESSQRSIVVKTWDQPKVKVTTTVYFEGESKLTDEEWLERINLSLKTLGSSVKIKSGAVSSSGVYYNNGATYSYNSGGSGVAIFNDRGQNIGTKANMKRIVTVTVPAGSKLDIESKYADITLPAGISDAIVDISNGNLEAENINKLILRSKYSNANVGDVKFAELEFTNGRFSAKSIDEMDVESKYSTIEMASAKKLVFRSTNDEYEIEEAGEVRGRKNYGNLRITKLNNSLEMDGSNADVKVRNVGSALTLIKLDNRYADVRVPLRAVKNYSVDFAGSYSSVYGNFEKMPVTATDAKEKSTTGSATTIDAPPAMVAGGGQNVVRLTTARSGWGSDSNNPSRFTAKVGDGSGLKIEMKCQNCTVDFK
jgi:hypothetical protein